ncbi:RNA polymerase II transcription factor complex subunit [Phaffia rhodozyma]|uniref:RNA polymerase II transcription factor complex subunit n=1 Tax=Phaffia rhodozyma TaxID=264483 RepID=A0A0F7SFE5_PHARH|nr:RNA polymerase II transcription factor complex subunit [Phaffia rhodozyma]
MDEVKSLERIPDGQSIQEFTDKKIMRRSVGISSLQAQQSQSKAYSSLSSQISQTQVESLRAQMDQFRSNLREFASKHREEIRKDPVFRMHFQRMCSHLSIDPLSGPLHGPSPTSISGLFSSLLPLSDWTYELLTQIVDIAISTRSVNGGLLPLRDLIRRLERIRGLAPNSGGISEEDIKRAVDTMGDHLGGHGWEIVNLSSGGSLSSGEQTKALRSTASVLPSDLSVLISLALGTGGRLIPAQVERELGWTADRVRTGLQSEMVEREGLGWVDDQGEGGKEYWVSGVVQWGESIRSRDILSHKTPRLDS